MFSLEAGVDDDAVSPDAGYGEGEAGPVGEENPVIATPECYAPTREEWERHKLTHVPFRSWCKQCVEGKAVNNPHKKSKDKDCK